METGIWPAEQKIHYATMMLYHNINNSDDYRKAKQVVEEQEQNQFKNTLYQTVKIIAKDLQIDISDATSTSKSVNQNEKKGKAIDRIRKRMKKDTLFTRVSAQGAHLIFGFQGGGGANSREALF